MVKMKHPIFYVTFPLILLPSLFVWFHLDTPAVTVTGLQCLQQRWFSLALALLAYYGGGIENRTPRREQGHQRSFFQIGCNVAHLFLVLILLVSYRNWHAWADVGPQYNTLQALQPAYYIQWLLVIAHWILFWRYGRERVYLEPRE